MVRDAELPAARRFLVFDQARVVHALVATRGLHVGDAAEQRVHVLLELGEVREGVDAEGHDELRQLAAAGHEAGAVAGEDAGHDVGHRREAHALVAAVLPRAAEGGHEELAVVRGVHPIHDRVAFEVGDPAGLQLRTDAAREHDLVGGHLRRGNVEHERRHFVRRRRPGDGVGAEHRLGAERRHHEVSSGGHHAHANHVPLDGHERVVGEHPHMAAVLHAHRAHAELLGLVHGDFHRLRPHLQADGGVGIQGGADRRLAHRPHVRHRIHALGAVAGHVLAQGVGDAVALAAPEVAGDQNVRAERRVGLGNAHRLEHRLRAGPRRLFRNPNLILFRNQKVLEHGATPPCPVYVLHWPSDRLGLGRAADIVQYDAAPCANRPARSPRP